MVNGVPFLCNSSCLTHQFDVRTHRQVSLYNLFSGREYQFDVPHYQRPYSWRTKQVFEMLQVRARQWVRPWARRVCCRAPLACLGVAGPLLWWWVARHGQG